MFTNWLTGTTGSSSASSSSGTNRSHDSPQTSNGLSLVSVNGLTSLNPNMITTPPDVVLEVGPGPSTMRFMAHSVVLGMHSGYLRSAIRLDERGAHQQHGAADFMVYLSNVTPEQFAPLLSYMYTGYLDLNVENIFGVLLATHVLHMPRALEICRSYLARAQAEGYFGTNNNSLTSPLNTAANGGSHQQSTMSTSKIIRPIASKPPLTNFGFLPIAHPIATSALTPLTNRTSTVTSGSATVPLGKGIGYDMESNKDEEDEIDVDELDRQSAKNERIRTISNAGGNDDDEDVEVFIDTTSEDADVVVETEIKKLSFRKALESSHKSSHKASSSATTHVKSRHDKSHKKSHRSDKRRKSGGVSSSSSGLQVAKAPIPASQLDTSEANKVIIDVASCDGPVRFKRILNTAYGHKPEHCSSASQRNGGGTGQERSLQSVSLSFHQQMAKTISQQQHLSNAEESENSETSNGSIGGGGGAGGGSVPKVGRKIQNEIFVCVYCKHTFKSQYCYQKHAKRHLNPLTLQATCVPPTEKRSTPEETTASSSLMTAEQPTVLKGPSLQNVRPLLARNSSSASGQQQSNHQGGSALSNPADFLRREVRPLDMNVQYYPCKTCGCKFPSYYFVHKHRKMCHADEEAAAGQQNNGIAVAVTTSTASSAPATTDQNDITVEHESKSII